MRKLGLIAFLLTIISVAAYSQCATWNDLPNKGEIEEAHVLYRDFFKAENYDEAFPYWEKAFKAAPAADGKRDLHFSNGVDMYLAKFKAETDEAKKEELKNTVLAMYDQWVECVKAGTITLLNTDMDKYVGYIRGREAFNMFYTLNVPYEDNIKVLDEAIEVAGNDSEYIVIDPYARIVNFQFTNELMTKEKAREVYDQLNEIADYNIKNNKQYGGYYQQSKDAMIAVYAPIENFIFDCDFFKDKLVPQYKADPENGELVKSIYNTLLQRGCEKEQPIMVELEAKYTAYADSVNAVRMAEFYKENPGAHARDLYKEGKYDEAIAKWEEAIEGAEEKDKENEYNFWIGYTTFHKKNSTSGVLGRAQKGTNASEVAGKAHMLIGDYYARVSSSCGDSWEQRLAILAALEEYRTAKSLDSEIASDANRKIGIYNASKPDPQEGFMRKVKEGQKVKAKCIGRTVTVDFAG
jgi:tetratricopeptide (TPR) repeat protein